MGLFIGNNPVLPQSTLLDIVNTHKAELESSIGANISDVKAAPIVSTPTQATTLGPTEPSSDDWKWIVIGVSLGVVVIIVIIVIAYCW